MAIVEADANAGAGGMISTRTSHGFSLHVGGVVPACDRVERSAPRLVRCDVRLFGVGFRLDMPAPGQAVHLRSAARSSIACLITREPTNHQRYSTSAQYRPIDASVV